MATISYFRISWRPELEVGVKQIDEQHKQLVAMLNQLTDLAEQGKDDGRLQAILLRLVRYTETHFAMEAGLMQAHRYPARVAHLGQHEGLAGKVREYQAEAKAGSKQTVDTLLVFLAGWLERHILGSDKQLAAYLRECGVR